MLGQRNERIATPTIDSGSRSLSFTGLYGGYAICLHRERRQDSAAWPSSDRHTAASYTHSPFGSTYFGPWVSDVSRDGL